MKTKPFQFISFVFLLPQGMRLLSTAAEAWKNGLASHEEQEAINQSIFDCYNKKGTWAKYNIAFLVTKWNRGLKPKTKYVDCFIYVSGDKDSDEKARAYLRARIEKYAPHELKNTNLDKLPALLTFLNNQ